MKSLEQIILENMDPDDRARYHEIAFKRRHAVRVYVAKLERLDAERRELIDKYKALLNMA